MEIGVISVEQYTQDWVWIIAIFSDNFLAPNWRRDAPITEE